jgi:DNA polymerase alpha subunit A
MDRSRRQPAVTAGRATARGALEALKAAREGGTKRVSNFEVKQEDAVYDVVEEQEYAKIVAKRRAEGGACPTCRAAKGGGAWGGLAR